MSKKIRISSIAENDLLEIVDFIRLENKLAANELLDELDDKLMLLLDQPEIGRKRPEIKKELRSFVFRSYVIFYESLPDSILIVRILHSARDIENIF